MIDLQHVRERARELAGPVTPARVAAEGICPFKGLASFEPVDTDYFFGRERLVAELVARLVGARFLGIVGPSGSGKSSALRAGLLPALAGGVLPGSEGWRASVAASRRAAPGRASPRTRVGSEGSSRRGARRAARQCTSAPRCRPVRGALHRLPLRQGARRVRRNACPRGRGSRGPRGRCGCIARRLLWTLRGLPGTRRPAGLEPGAGRADAGFRATASRRAARRPCGAAQWSPSWPTRWSTMWKASRARSAAVHRPPRALAEAAGRRAHPGRLP